MAGREVSVNRPMRGGLLHSTSLNDQVPLSERERTLDMESTALFLTVQVRLLCMDWIPQQHGEYVQTSFSGRDISQTSQSLSELEYCVDSC